MQLTMSPFGENSEYEYAIRENTSCLHPIPGLFAGYYIKEFTLYILPREPCGDLHEMPESVWLRIFNPLQSGFFPFELKRQGDKFFGRWLDVNGRLVKPGVLDALSGTEGRSVLESERQRHGDFMSSWGRFHI